MEPRLDLDAALEASTPDRSFERASDLEHQASTSSAAAWEQTPVLVGGMYNYPTVTPNAVEGSPRIGRWRGFLAWKGFVWRPPARAAKFFDIFHSPTKRSAAEKRRRRRNKRVCLELWVNIALMLERVDEQMLPAMYKYIGDAFGASPSQLGGITACQAIMQAVTAPIAGILGHYFSRVCVIAVGCAMWSVTAAAFGLCTGLRQGMFFWALNGVGIAIVMPSGQSLIADVNSPAAWGRSFGILYLTGATGGVLGALFATNLGAATLSGIEGWRLACLIVAAVALCVGLLTYLNAEDPYHPRLGPAPPPAVKAVVIERGAGEGDGDVEAAPASRARKQLLWVVPEDGANSPDKDDDSPPRPLSKQGSLGPLAESALEPLWEMGRQARVVLSVPSFIILVLMGIVGCMADAGVKFTTLYLQLVGMGSGAASLIVACSMAGSAASGMLGGVLGDAAAVRAPTAGRIATAQASLLFGMPLVALFFKGLPKSGSTSSVAIHAGLAFSWSLVRNWFTPACNNPLMAEVVPARSRSVVYAFGRSMETALGALASPAVGFLAERMFGYYGTSEGSINGISSDMQKADALSSAIVVSNVFFKIICLLLYVALYWTYPRDKLKAAGIDNRLLSSGDSTPIAAQAAADSEASASAALASAPPLSTLAGDPRLEGAESLQQPLLADVEEQE